MHWKSIWKREKFYRYHKPDDCRSSDFPLLFGAALKLQGVQELLDGIGKYVGDNVSANYDQADNRLQNSGDAQQFGARVYKISRDPQGNRLTHMKITSGELKVKSL